MLLDLAFAFWTEVKDTKAINRTHMAQVYISYVLCFRMSSNLKRFNL